MRRFYYGAADFIRTKYHLDVMPDNVTPLHDGTIEVTHDHQKLQGSATTMFRLALQCNRLDDFWEELQTLRPARKASNRCPN
jgi:hypothetical protein